MGRLFDTSVSSYLCLPFVNEEVWYKFHLFQRFTMEVDPSLFKTVKWEKMKNHTSKKIIEKNNNI